MQLQNKVRVPVQARSREKFENILIAAESLIIEKGIEQTSIPEIAKITGLPRATIYQYFPDMYVLYAYLAEKHMQIISAILEEKHPSETCTSWRSYIVDLLKTNASYYDDNPVAKALLLNGPFGHSDLEAHKAKHQALAQLLKNALEASKAQYQLPDSPNALIIAIEIGFACFRYGYWYEETIDMKVVTEAETAITQYLSLYIAD